MFGEAPGEASPPPRTPPVDSQRLVQGQKELSAVPGGASVLWRGRRGCSQRFVPSWSVWGWEFYLSERESTSWAGVGWWWGAEGQQAPC